MKTLDFTSGFTLRALNSENAETGIFEGHAAIFDLEDRGGEIIRRGAFQRSVHKDKKHKVKMLRQHDQNNIIGIWEELREDDKGLFVRGKLLIEDIPKAKETHALLRAEALDGLSIGFLPTKATFNRETEVNEIEDLELFEISLVAIPRQADATITAVRELGVEDIQTKTDLEKALRNVGFSTATSKYICAGWTPPALRNAEGDTKLVERMNALAKSMKTATGVIRNDG